MDTYTLGDIRREVIILGEDCAGHCFVLRDLIPINFSKWSWNWKYAPQAKFLENLCLKTIRGTFCPSMGSVIKRGMGWNMMPVAWNRLVLMPVPETDYQCHNRNICITETRILLKTYSQKLGYILTKMFYCCMYLKL